MERFNYSCKGLLLVGFIRKMFHNESSSHVSFMGVLLALFMEFKFQRDESCWHLIMSLNGHTHTKIVLENKIKNSLI